LKITPFSSDTSRSSQLEFGKISDIEFSVPKGFFTMVSIQNKKKRS
jgi:hypothetical protein